MKRWWNILFFAWVVCAVADVHGEAAGCDGAVTDGAAGVPLSQEEIFAQIDRASRAGLVGIPLDKLVAGQRWIDHLLAKFPETEIIWMLKRMSPEQAASVGAQTSRAELVRLFWQALESGEAAWAYNEILADNRISQAQWASLSQQLALAHSGRLLPDETRWVTHPHLGLCYILPSYAPGQIRLVGLHRMADRSDPAIAVRTAFTARHPKIPIVGEVEIVPREFPTIEPETVIYRLSVRLP